MATPQISPCGGFCSTFSTKSGLIYLYLSVRYINVHKGRLPRSYLGAARYSLVMTYLSPRVSLSLFALCSLILLRRLFLLAARHSMQASSALAPQRRLLFALCSLLFHLINHPLRVWHDAILSYRRYSCYTVTQLHSYRGVTRCNGCNCNCNFEFLILN